MEGEKKTGDIKVREKERDKERHREIATTRTHKGKEENYSVSIFHSPFLLSVSLTSLFAGPYPGLSVRLLAFLCLSGSSK